MFGLASKSKQGLQLEPSLNLMVLPPINITDNDLNAYAIGLQVNCKNQDSISNQTIKITNTKTITSLSLILEGFDTLTSLETDCKVAAGSVILHIERTNSENQTEVESIVVSEGKYPVLPLKAATKKKSAEWESAKEIHQQINEIWQEEFSYALEDFHEELGNDFANPESSPTPMLKRKSVAKKKSNGSFLANNWVNIVSISAIVLALGIFGYGYISKYKNNSAGAEQMAVMGDNAPGQVIIPDSTEEQLTESQALEKETLGEFGLESGISLDQ